MIIQSSIQIQLQYSKESIAKIFQRGNAYNEQNFNETFNKG